MRILLPIAVALSLAPVALAQQLQVPVYFAHDDIPIRALSVGLSSENGMTTTPRGAVPCRVTDPNRTCMGMVFVDPMTDAGIPGVKFVLRTKSDGDRTRTSDKGGLVSWEVTRGEQMWGEVTFVPAAYSQRYLKLGVNYPLKKLGTQCCAGFVQWQVFPQ